VARANIGNVRQEQEFKHQAEITWDFIERCRDRTKLPIIVKGIATGEDAQLAVDRGVDVVYVSNHGGRQLDHGRGTIEMLPEIAAAVAGKAEIVLDGGILRGTDVVKALALGANSVAIGKLQGWGLGAGGKEGLLRVLEILENEIAVAMGLLGVTRVDQLTPSYVCPGAPVSFAHEMSAFPHLPGGRLL